ncbi:thiamine diphosphokinase [Paenibacillus algorifonticola]|uniref:thiamine diphosphokinase n=1 Tax=Paenibacillus algorifonticola TaxID=684063 RepID=UPI003D2A8735
MMPQRIVICSGGELGTWALPHLKQDAFRIGADRGALFLVEQGYSPQLAIGDFDSVTDEQLEQIRSASTELITCDPIYKDYTDTEMALRYALEQNPDEIILLGALGTRFDHSLSNVQLLVLAEQRGIPACIIDQHNCITVTSSKRIIQKGLYANVSLLPLSSAVSGITLTGFQYPLQKANLQIGQSLGISNILTETEGSITIDAGLLLIIQSRD